MALVVSGGVAWVSAFPEMGAFARAHLQEIPGICAGASGSLYKKPFPCTFPKNFILYPLR